MAPPDLGRLDEARPDTLMCSAPVAAGRPGIRAAAVHDSLRFRDRHGLALHLADCIQLRLVLQ